MPVLRPLIGTDKLEITEEASARDVRDLHRARRRLLHAVHPAPPGHAHGGRRGGGLEARLDIERLVALGVEAAEQETFEFPAGAGPYPTRGERRRSVRESISE